MAIEQMKLERSGVVERPSWDCVEAALRALNGEDKDGIVLKSDGPSYMGISGGEDGWYAIIGFLEGFGEFICASGAQDGPPRDVVVAGDYNSFASKHVIGIQTVLAAAKAFFERGALSDELEWEKS